MVVTMPSEKTSAMKVFKLIVHQKNFSGEDLILNPKDFPAVKLHDIVEIYHPEDEFSRLLLQVTSLREDLQQKDTTSVEQSIATTFQLRTYTDVNVRIVDPATVALDSVELTFKDQYLGRSEMWRLKNSLVHTCVYINKKIEFCGGSLRCQVYEMWAGGERVACGVITDATKVVFRSSTSMVYLFIQMSSEMWDFDIHGDLYFEKAVNGFLSELFAKWKKNGSNHEVTIVLFSRTFYKAHGLDEFPEHMRDCLQQDYRGRFYEDFYRVAIQNERYDDWNSILTQLRRVFVDYRSTVLECHQRPGVTIPRAVNSTAARGNFLEVLNMSLNVFEKHYLDRSFDRTGQLSVVITPGVGVFEVDRELTNITKQRIIDNGVGSDLVCVGEQPLHAVPLLKFHNKDSSVSVGDDYSMPHWINLSFYSSNKKVGYSTFVPRIKLPSRKNTSPRTENNNSIPTQSKLLQDENPLPNSIYDYDAYDAKVFHLPTSHSNRCSLSLQRASAQKKSSNPDGRLHSQRLLSRKMSDPDIRHASVDSTESNGGLTLSKSAAINIPLCSKEMPQYSSSFGALNIEGGKSKVAAGAAGNEWDGGEAAAGAQVVGTDGSPYEHNPLKKYLLRPGRALINPFDPSHVTIKLTSNRRRWTHIFPKGPTGVLIQQHHYQAVPAKSSEDQSYDTNSVFGSPTPLDVEIIGASKSKSNSHNSSQETAGGTSRNIRHSSDVGHQSNKSLTLLWGATGEQEWTPALTTGFWNERDRDFFILELQEYGDTAVGVDWKSLTIPACLPITTDYFPDERSLQNDYVVSDYNLLPDDVNADYAQQRAIYRRPLTTMEVFKELVSQRLAQGFQLIVLPPPAPPSTSELQTSNAAQFQGSTGTMSWSKPMNSEPVEEYLLSIGRIFHKIALCGSTVTVTRYRPRHPYPVKNIHYRYRFQAPDHSAYEVSWVEFTTEKLENYNWNYLDHYICTRGDPDFALQEAWCSQMQSFKFWRFRMYLLPLHHPGTKKIGDGSEHCDTYTSLGKEELCNLVDGFLRFMETCINKIRRPTAGKKPRGRRETSTSSTSSFRERLGSNRITEYHRPRSGSKVMDRVKTEGTANGRASPALDTGDQKMHTLSLDVSLDGEASHDDGAVEPKPLKSNASFSEILEAMKNPNTGVSFCQHPNLPNLAFVSADATTWLVEHMEGVASEFQAMSIFEEMLKEKLICHASGKSDHPFIYGFYMYYMVSTDKESASKDGEGFRPNGDLSSFENEWIEVHVQHYRTQSNVSSGVAAASPQSKSPTSSVPDFLLPDLNYLSQNEKKPRYPISPYKGAYLDVDINSRSDREEWGHAKYQSSYRPDEAFEMVVQWMTATGAIVTDLLQGWARKGQLYGFQLVPVPDDPFALPYSFKSDPLRGPVFVPINVECLLGNKSFLFQEFPEETWDQRLFLLHEAIARRFGFVRCQMDHAQHQYHHQGCTHPHAPQQHYVHTTGNMFVLIPSKASSLLLGGGGGGGGTPAMAISAGGVGGRMSSARRVQREREPAAPSPHEEYITRHVTGKNRDSYYEERRIGFLWSWNYLVSKRWRYSPNHTLGDENFQNKALKDFQAFCANDKNRLKDFWDKCWEQSQ